MRKTLKERFDMKWEAIPESGCWIWTGSSSNGYGQIWDGAKYEGAHRISYILHKGEIPDLDQYHGMCVCHTCDTSYCVNPDHLFLGTHKENIEDMINKGRDKHDFGENNGNSTLREIDVINARAIYKYSKNATFRKLANIYGVALRTMWLAIKGETWKHIE